MNANTLGIELKRLFCIFTLAISVLSVLISFTNFAFAQEDEQIMEVEANILTGVISNVSGNESIIKIQVPSYIHLGDAKIGELSNETKIQINNTGNVKPIKITAEIIDSTKEAYQYLQIKDTSWKFVDDFISSNVSIKKTLYLRFDLRNFDNIEEDLIGYTNQIRFTAMPA